MLSTKIIRSKHDTIKLFRSAKANHKAPRKLRRYVHVKFPPSLKKKPDRVKTQTCPTTLLLLSSFSVPQPRGRPVSIIT